MGRKLHLNLFVQERGHHESAWRHAGAAPHALTDIRYYQDLARRAEAAKFDSIFFADTLAIDDLGGSAAKGALEPITTLAALASVTERIGLIATASTTYTEPYNLARQFASLDHISGGRIGWNVVTSWAPGAGPNFGYDRMIAHTERYERATEFVDIVAKLWDSWADDAVVDDRAGGLYTHPARITPINVTGRWRSVAGPLNIPRPPQGHPVLVQAGSSADGRHFAARFAEAIFTAHLERRTAVEFYQDIKTRVAAVGRRPDQVAVLPGISAAIGGTEAQAQRLLEELADLSDPSVGLGRLSDRFGGHDFSRLRLDDVLSADDFPAADTVQGAQSRAKIILGFVERERPTLRQLIRSLSGARGHLTVAGTPEQIAGLIEDWFLTGAADGFNVMPPILPAQFDVFAGEVVPILRAKGLFRTEYAGATLRDHYGLDRPESQYFSSGASDREAVA